MNIQYASPNIDYRLLADAEKFYQKLSYQKALLPWFVPYKAYTFNKINFLENEDCYTNGGYLVGSAEQSFLHEMLNGHIFSNHYSITPCFRNDNYDETHFACFMKLELIKQLKRKDDPGQALKTMISDALSFFNQYVDAVVLDTKDGAFDIISKDGTELGSYGIRNYEGLIWVYGTGVALPRLTFAAGFAS